MDVDRVVRIVPRSSASRGPSGTGYLIAPRLVLTAAHLVPDDPAAAPCVTTAQAAPASHPAPPPYATTLRWTTARTGAYDGGPDAALLEITDPAWRPPPSFQGPAGRRPQRWGRLVTDTMGQPVCCHGFARVQRGAAGDVGLEQLSARINPFTGFPARRYELTGTTSAFGAARDTGSPWAGMSGAAVFTADPTRTPGELSPGVLLLGVVRADRGAATGVRLSVTRTEDLLGDPEFRAVVGAHNGGLPPEPEAVELVGLLAPVAAQRDLRSPLTVLRADVEAVAFRGREEKLAELRHWCVADDSAHQVATLVGPGGQGKSRCARELAAGLRAEGWVAGRLQHETVRRGGSHGTADALRPLRGVVRPLLIIVDYAETRPDLVRQLIGLADSARDRFRVLLLARSTGTWMDTALGRSALAYGMRDSTPEFVLRPMYTAPGPAAKAFRLALADLAQVLGQVRPGAHRLGDVDWPELAARIPTPRLDDGHETPLSLQMRALEALLGHAAGDPVGATNRGSVEPALLDHEASYWSSTAAALGFDADHDVDDALLLRRTVAAASLCGAADRAEGRATLARLPHPGTVPVDKLDRWLGTLYPAAHDRHWGTLHPDRLAEFQASAEVVDDPGLLPALLDGASDEQWTHAFTVLTRAVVAHANESRPEAARAVLDRLHHVLDHIDEAPVGLASLRACSEALPSDSHVLSRLALRMAEVVVDRHARAGAHPPSDAERAGDLHNLAHHLRVMADWAGAVQAAETSLNLRRRLALEDPETYEPDLAASYELSARAVSQAELGEARDRIGRSLRIQRRLHRNDPEQHRLQLVRCLRTASYIEWNSGDREESARLDAEGAELSRLLEESEPGQHLGLRTRILDNLSISHWYAKRFPDAIRITTESLRLLGEQMAVNPDAHAPAYASALESQALNYDSTGRLEEAIPLCRRSAEIYRRYAAEYPELYEDSLARVLHNLALLELDGGDRAVAFAHMVEATDLRTRRCASDPGTVSSRDLRSSSYWLGRWLLEDDEPRRAVDACQEGVDALRRVLAAEPRPETHAELAGDLEQLGRCHEFLARATPDDAQAQQTARTASLQAFRESVRHYRTAAAGSDDPGSYDDDLWTAVHGLADGYRLSGSAGLQRALLRSALPMLRRRAAQEPDRRPALAACLADLGEAYRDTRLRRRGLLLLQEAVALEAAVARDKELAGEAEPDAAAPNLRAYLVRLRNAQYRLHRYAEAARSGERVVTLLRRERETDPGQAPLLAHDIVELALAYAHAGHCARAERLAAEGVAAARAEAAAAQAPLDIGATLRAQAQTLLECARRTGSLQMARKALGPAEEALLYRRRRWNTDRSAHAWELRDTAFCLADVLDRLGRSSAAADVRNSLAPPPRRRGTSGGAAPDTSAATTEETS
ncbi:hypothetical protein ABZV77_24880 [Streptomyces sp. NPDC004732]|uniref:hypothetical protein n=1 Tax=Streptomyces sp. NPDC004732 TaxID=3154290 RepID=UPI0033AF1F4D